MPTLPTDRTTSNTAAEHVADHNALHAEYTTPTHTHSGSTVPHPDNIPASPHADDYEFNETTSSLPTGWSWLNQGSSTYVEALGAGLVTDPGHSGYQTRGLVRAVPAGASWTVTQKVSMNGGLGTPDFYAGVILRESSTSKLFSFYKYSVSTADNFYVDRWTNNTTYLSNVTNGAYHGRRESTIYLRIKKNSATSWDFLISPDGIGYSTVVAAHNVSTHMTPDQIGFAINTVTTIPGGVACHWYRVT